MDPKTAYDRRDEVQIVDVREHDEWASGHIEDAVHIPMNDVPQRLDALDRERPVVTVCASGKRSDEVAKYLNRSGFSADNLDGGIQNWSEQGLPVVQ